MRGLLLVMLLAAPSAFASEPSKLTLLEVDSTALTTQLLDRQIRELKFSRWSLVGPMTTLSVSGTTFVAGGVVFALAVAQGSFVFVIGIVIAAVALVPLAIGLAWLVANNTHNARVDAAIRRHEEERSHLVTRLPATMVELAAF